MRHTLTALVMITGAFSGGCIRLLQDPDSDKEARKVQIGGDGDVDYDPFPGSQAVGDRCEYDFDCEEPLKCESSKCAEPECRSNADCEGERCDDGECVPECKHDFDCGFLDGRCEAGHCVDTSCTSNDSNPNCAPYGCDPETKHCRRYCSNSRECAKGYVCNGGCVPACTRIDDPVCEGSLCDVATGKCHSNVCTARSECAGGYVCEEYSCLVDLEAPKCSAANASVCGSFACKTELGHCATHCSSDSDCPSGKGCAIAYCDIYSCGYTVEKECRSKCTAEDSSICGAYRCEPETLTCADHCFNDSECASGYTCNLSDHTCQADPTAVKCTQDSECGAFACGSNGKCFSACGSKADCGDGAVCEGIQCTYPCTTQNDPVCQGYKCSVGATKPTCQTSCYNNLNCQAGYTCQDERCEPAPASVTSAHPEGPR